MKKLYRKLLKKYDDDDEIVINIILVNENIRPAFLLESANYNHDYFSEMVDIISQINCLNTNKKLLIKKDDNDFTRYFIYLKNSFVDKTIIKNKNSVNKNKYIARFLGFQCIGHSYNDPFIDRISHKIFIYNHDTDKLINLVAEVCELKKEPVVDIVENYYKNFQSNIQTLFYNIGKENYKVSYQIKIFFSNYTKKDMLINYYTLESTDKNYLLKDIYEDFENHYIGEPILNESVLREKLQLLKEETISETDFTKLIYLYSITIINQLIDEQFNKLFRNKKRTHENIEKFYNKVKDWDTKYWSTEDYEDMISEKNMNFKEIDSGRRRRS